MTHDDHKKPKSRQIYSNVYHKRIDTREAVSCADLKYARMINGTLVFDSPKARYSAFKDGIFLLEIPKGIDVSAGDGFAQQFHKGRCPSGTHRIYREITGEQFSDKLLGFHERSNQLEQFLLERRFWRDYYPHSVNALGEQMTELSRQLIVDVLKDTGIPTSDWVRATGGCSQKSGSYHLTFNHYRPMVQESGLNSHKDDGFLTILRVTEPGLEVNCRNQWERVPVVADHFVVNFGLTMELLTSRCDSPLAAIMHRVSRQFEERYSFGHFSSSNCLEGSDGGIYIYAFDEGIVRVCSSRELIEMNDEEIYQGTLDPEG